MPELGAFLLPVAPLLALLVSLLLGRYPGCDAIAELAERISSGRRSAEATSSRRPAPSRSHTASGGLLIALGLAQRPPPLLA